MSELNLLQRINKVMGTVKEIHKGKSIKAGQGSYKVVLHDDVTALLHDPLAEAGIVVTQSFTDVVVTSDKVDKYGNPIFMASGIAKTTFYNCDDRTDFLDVECFGYAFDQGDKAVGKAFSMASKYIFLKTFMLESCDEEENRDVEPSKPKAKTETEKPASVEQINLIKMMAEKHSIVLTDDQFTGMTMVKANEWLKKLKIMSEAKK